MIKYSTIMQIKVRIKRKKSKFIYIKYVKHIKIYIFE